jgi:AMP phosphorylase
MKLKIKKIRLGAGRPIAFIHQDDALSLNMHIGDRVEIFSPKNKVIALVDVVKGIISRGEIALSDEITDYLKARPSTDVSVRLALEPKSTIYITKKLNGSSLSKKEIFSIIKDIVNNALTEAEIAYFVSGVYENGMTMRETLNLTEAVYETGHKLKWREHLVADKHSIGGIPGNRTTPIVVSICAAAGVLMPKTSSRAITSAAGTADVVETLARVDFSPQELKKIVERVGACLAWGGSLGLAPADDKLIRVERLLSLDPESQLIASIMAKKLAMGSKYILIDIPFGDKAKVSRVKALALKKKFLIVAKHFNLKMEVVLTDGSQPIGNGVGPVLEMRDVLRVLRRENSPKDLEDKSLFLASRILEMVGKARPHHGMKMARNILESGKAYKKFEEILSAQGKHKDGLKDAKRKHDIVSSVSGIVKKIDNKAMNYLGRILGCPVDKSAGLYLYKHVGARVEKGEIILTLYSESRRKLAEALDYYRDVKPILIK